LLGLLIVCGSTISRMALEPLMINIQFLTVLLEGRSAPAEIEPGQIKIIISAAEETVTMTGKSLLFAAQKNDGGADELRARDLVGAGVLLDGVRRWRRSTIFA